MLMGRLTRDPEVRYTAGENATAVARYTLAVDRRFTRRDDNGTGQTADFIGCVAFGKSAEFAEKYLHQGSKIAVTGRIQTGSYISRDGQKVYTTDVVVEEQEFAESKRESATSGNAGANRPGSQNWPGAQSRPGDQGSWKPEVNASGFMNIPEGFDAELPFE